MAKAKDASGAPDQATSDQVTLVANYQVILDAEGNLAAEGETFTVAAKAAAELIACGAAKLTSTV
jgi:hypothetical protein